MSPRELATGKVTGSLGKPGPGVKIAGASTAPADQVRPSQIRGRVKLWSAEAGVTIMARHGALPKVIQERAGGWQASPRPGMRGITEWDGPNLIKVQVTLMLDGLTGASPAVSVKPVLDDLRSLGNRAPKLDRAPTLEVIGAVPYAKEVGAWVIESLDIEDLVAHPDGRGEPALSRATIVLLEHNEGSIDATRIEATKKTSRYVWKSGDSLDEVAEDRLGDARRASWIRQANPEQTRKGWSHVKAGTEIRIPTLREVG